MKRKRLLLIGFDAGDTELIEQWCEAGYLPHISRMRQRGVWGRMQTTAEVVHVSAWPSIFTGAAPDEHGLYHAYVMHPGQQNPVRPRPEQRPVPFLWRLLNDAGKHCVIMDAFMTCPLQNFNGAQIVEWGTWSWFSEPTILPEALKKDMTKQFGAYPAEDHSKVGMTPPPDPDGFYKRILAGVTKKTEAVKWLLSREDWDLFLVVFGESHSAGHYFWHYHDPDYMTHPEDGGGHLQTALREVYVALDRAVGELMAAADEEVTVMLVSGDGMGPNYSGSHILPELLSRMALFNHMPQGDDATAGQSPKTIKKDMLSTLRNMVPKSVRSAVSRTLLPRSVNEKLSLRWKTAGISWEHTQAFLIENANEGYIRINLKGREPQGTVEPGAAYEALCEKLYQALKGMTNPANGQPAAHRVYKTDEIYSGPCRSHMPDLIVTWNEAARITTDLTTAEYGVVRHAVPGCQVAPYYSGNHRPNAFTVAVGPGIAPGTLPEGASIMDLAPSILSHFDVAPPAYMQGRVLGELGMPASSISLGD
ncbi:alkaline phosphatase family protein [Candidatus Entotheonella palauensis]|uniref:Phosphodiesterase n=1 Tax=Candidatus Entotheonella gemina TaxID=1429439 RepID=W4MEI2_9BACT|nr:alkaline phosphatase family protein [Candidatus Entotheonella palauensis]ETX08595.1 MAG: hypothetical protein ETSY2_04470 [Candidatus Entotheonella gemina]